MSAIKQRILREVTAIPSMPGVASKLLKLLNSPTASAAQVEDVLRYDPGLTANVLKMANSSYFGFVSKIGSIRRAVSMMGFKRISQLVVASCVSAIFEREIAGYELSPGDLWRHSVAVSLAAEEISRTCQLQGMEDLFTAGLLHDVGKLVMGDFVRDELVRIEEVVSEKIPFIEAERQILGTDHAEIGALILRKWTFPEEIVTAVRWHHQPDALNPSDLLTDVVHLANVLCAVMGIGVGREGLRQNCSPKATRRLNLRKIQLEAIASRTIEWLDEMTEIFSNR